MAEAKRITIMVDGVELTGAITRLDVVPEVQAIEWDLHVSRTAFTAEIDPAGVLELSALFLALVRRSWLRVDSGDWPPFDTDKRRSGWP